MIKQSLFSAAFRGESSRTLVCFPAPAAFHVRRVSKNVVGCFFTAKQRRSSSSTLTLTLAAAATETQQACLCKTTQPSECTTSHACKRCERIRRLYSQEVQVEPLLTRCLKRFPNCTYKQMSLCLEKSRN